VVPCVILADVLVIRYGAVATANTVVAAAIATIANDDLVVLL
jgi:hypothetical protein